MSVKTVAVDATDYSGPVKAEDLNVGDSLTVEVMGVTTLTSVPASGSYRIYGLDGKDMASGVLSSAMTISPPIFDIVITFMLTADAMTGPPSEWFEFGVDVFQESSGSDEAFCIEIGDNEYVTYEENKPTPPFVMNCWDEGNGTFIPGVHPITPAPIPSPSCAAPPPGCDLNWYYCPRDPGCTTYDMSVLHVEVSAAAVFNNANMIMRMVLQVDVGDATAINPGDGMTLYVNGTTQLRSIPAAGTFRIYDLAGHNIGTGVLSAAMTLYNCGANGCYFGFQTAFTANTGCFTPSPQNWFEFGLDIFQESGGSDEAFCIEIANDNYVQYEEASQIPSPGFVTYCEDEGWGHFVNHTQAEVVFKAVCKLL